jgi:hypothetical protein
MWLALGLARDALSVSGAGLGRGVLVGGQPHALRKAIQLRHVSLLQLEHEVACQRLMSQPFLREALCGQQPRVDGVTVATMISLRLRLRDVEEMGTVGSRGKAVPWNPRGQFECSSGSPNATAQ